MTNEEVLNTFANKMLSAVEGIEAFGKEQIPEYVEQILMYNFYESVAFGALSLFFCLVVLTALVVGIIQGRRKGWGQEKPSVWAIITMIFSSLFFAPGIAIFCHGFLDNLEDAVKIHVAPKVYIVDYFRDQVK